MKNYWLTGVIILLPLALTLMIIFFLFDLFTAPFVNVVGPLVLSIEATLPFTLPNGFTLVFSRFLSLIFLCFSIFLLGVVTQWLIVRNLIGWGSRLISRIPLVKTIYKMSKDIFAALFSSDGKKAFKRPVMFPFPGRPNFSLGFEAGEVAAECQAKVQKRLVPVFSPTAPHPISGFLFLIPEENVKDVDMSKEEVVKFLVSCGMVVPENPRK
jgi:uncharacterized membrane protein